MANALGELAAPQAVPILVEWMQPRDRTNAALAASVPPPGLYSSIDSRYNLVCAAARSLGALLVMNEEIHSYLWIVVAAGVGIAVALLPPGPLRIAATPTAGR